jgi:hypothetical protein
VTDPAAMQEVIVGGAAAAAAGVALVWGQRPDPTPCERCAGGGGVTCFACEGSGVMDGGAPAAARELTSSAAPPPLRRDPLGRAPRGRECRACCGVGRLLCQTCSGSGYK